MQKLGRNGRRKGEYERKGRKERQKWKEKGDDKTGQGMRKKEGTGSRKGGWMDGVEFNAPLDTV